MRCELYDRIFRRTVLVITTGLIALGAAPPLALSQDVVIELTIDRVIAEDRIDSPPCAIWGSRKADFFAKVSIAQEPFPATEPIVNQNDVSPKWNFKKRVPIGAANRHDIVVQIWDHSVGLCAGDALVDINPSPGKRDLRLILDVVACNIHGDIARQKRGGSEVCYVGIDARGTENKKAMVSFHILVNPAK